MKIAVIVATGLCALLGILANFPPLERRRPGRRRVWRWITERKVGINVALGFATFVLLGLTLADHLQQPDPLEVRLDPNGNVVTKVQASAIEREIRAEAGDRERKAVRLIERGDDLLNQQRIAEAAAAYRESAEIMPSRMALLNLALCQRYQSELDAAIDTLRKSRKMSSDTPLAQLLDANALLHLGSVYSRKGDPEQASANLREASKQFIKLKHVGGEAAAEYELGILAYRTGDPAGAAKHFAVARDKFAETKSDIGQATLLSTLAIVDTDQGRTRQAIESLSEARILFQGANQRVSEAGVLLALGNARQSQCDLTPALHAFEEAATIAEEAGNRALSAQAVANAANIFLEQRNTTETRRRAGKALQIARSAQAVDAEGSAHLYLATAARLEGDLTEAKRELQIAKEQLWQLDVLYQIALLVADAQIALAARELGHAEESLDEAMKLAKAASYYHEQVTILIAKSDVAMVRGDRATAIQVLEAARDISRSHGSARCDSKEIPAKLTALGV